MATPEKDEGDVVDAVAEFDEQSKVATLIVQCHDGDGKPAEHRVTITTTEVKIHDHSKEDLQSELALAQLGGKVCPCARIALWEHETQRDEEREDDRKKRKTSEE